jgi:hypothetical protein
MSSSRRFDWRTGVVILGLVVSLALIVIFSLRVMRYVRHPQNEPIRAWMSVPYIAHSYHVPASDLYTAIGLPGDRRDRRPLMAIAREQRRPVSELIQAVYEAIVQAHPTVLPPSPIPSTPGGVVP